MRRGDVLIGVAERDFGKPRPAVVLQSDDFPRKESVTIAPLTTDLSREPLLRVQVEPDGKNGLRQPSDVCLDKLQTIRIGKIDKVIGRLSSPDMHRVDDVLRVFLDLQ